MNLKMFNKYIHHVPFQMEELKMVRIWFDRSFLCMGMDLKDIFFHVPLSPKVKKFLQFAWKGDFMNNKFSA